ncbi:MAG TPA: AAC(3) family N-acetyltransferase [Anaerolineales bacterium]|nr:AAC(3) family N-acetyltransferase [Anaerolineales bacterium]
MAVRLRDLLLGLRELHLGEAPVIVHSSLKSLGQVEGGAQTVVNALAGVFTSLLVPTFTYKTMLTPLTGPEHNAVTYGSGEAHNRMAEFFTPRMPADPMMGIIPETLRKQPQAARSSHPIQSFAGINATALLNAQTMTDPLGPLGALERAGGWAVLLGVNHTVNTSIHYAEKLAGRRQFLRWALTPKGVVECPGFPGDSAGFEAIAPDMEKYTRTVQIGAAAVQAMPLAMLFKAVITRIKKDPLALLCQQADCERCGEIRRSVLRDQG